MRDKNRTGDSRYKPPRVPDTTTQAVIAMTLDYYAPKEIAQQLGISYGMVRVILTRARADGKLRRYISGGIRISGDAFAVLRKKAQELTLPVEIYILEYLKHVKHTKL